MNMKLLSNVRLFATPWTIACQASLSMGFSRQQHWNRLSFPSPRDLSNAGIETGSPTSQTDALPSEPPRKSQLIRQLRAALQDNDLTGVATLVPQTNLPETPSYTEGETLKAKSESFQEDHMGWFQKEQSQSLLSAEKIEKGNIQDLHRVTLWTLYSSKWTRKDIDLFSEKQFYLIKCNWSELYLWDLMTVLYPHLLFQMLIGVTR